MIKLTFLSQNGKIYIKLISHNFKFANNDRSANMIKADDVENRDGFSNITTTTTEGGEGGNLDDDNINKKGRNSWIKR